MKKLILLLLITVFANAQNPTRNVYGFGAGFATNDMAASAIIEARSTTKGFLFPRMTTTQRNAISSPATSLVIFNTTTGAYNYYDGDSWETFGGGSQDLQSIMENGASYFKTVGDFSQNFGFTSDGNFDIALENTVNGKSFIFSTTDETVSSSVGSFPAGNAGFSYDIWNGFLATVQNIFGTNQFKIPYRTSGTGQATFLVQNNLTSGEYYLATTNQIPTVDATPTDGSSNAVSSNGVFDALADKANLTGSTSVDFQVPTTPAGANSAASKNYIDNALTGLTWKNAVKCSTTANHSLSGTSNVDGVTVPAGTRVLVRFQTAPAENGIYITASGAWTRATDADSASELTETTVLVTAGTLYKNTQWTQNGTITTVGTDAVNFVQVAGAGTYTNGTGIDLTANVFSINSSVATLTGSQTLTNKSISGATNTLSNIPQSAVTNLSTDLSGKADKSNTVLSTYLEVPEQSKPATPTNASRLYIDSSNRLSWIGENGYVRTFDGTANTADRVYTFPNTSGTLSLGTGTANRIGYWVDSNTLGALDTSTYPSLSELANVKGLNSSAQNQINTKSTKLINDGALSSNLTGTLSETIIKSYTFSGGTISSTDVIDFTAKVIKSGTAGNSRMRVYINNTSATSLTGNIFDHSVGAATIYWKALRSITFRGGNAFVSNVSAGGVTDVTTFTSAQTSVTLDTTTTWYLIITLSAGSTADTLNISEVRALN